MLVSAKSVDPSATENIFTTNSGMLVPKATTVIPITRLLTPKRLASPEAPLTKPSAPKTKNTKPNISARTNIHGLVSKESKFIVKYN